ncbi:hypothetical protein DSO57_1017556 [Entomophthora muscae]|uniref:Uncharacterized protein n=1 Tax=Entomophthora muscae TaxID=34485 RepID=A0ACC2STL5_9FUNG|nr:hypothetical protein DSO57_1017556 [Entomophthora muscae]
METDGNKTQPRSRSTSKNKENSTNENQEETQVAQKIRKIKPRKTNEEQPTLMKFAEGAPVAEEATGETIIITRDGDKVTEVAAFTPSWFYGGYQSLVAPYKCKVPRSIFGPRLGCISQTIKKVARVQAKPLQNLEDLAHTVDERFVLAFPAEVLISPLESPPTTEETLIWLDCLLSWCCLVLKQLANQQKNAGHMKLERSNLWPGEIGYQNPRPEVSQVTNSSGLGVPRPETIGFRSSPVETSEEGIRGNAHPESLEGS